MKIKKIYESTELDTSEKVSWKFFEKCGNFGSEELFEDSPIRGKIEMIFYFPAIGDEELEEIFKCRKYINYSNFFINNDRDNLLLHIILTKAQQRILDKKIDLELTRDKFNL